MADHLAQLAEALARDPASLAFLELGESLRRSGSLEAARRLAVQGLERHPHLADAHALFGRILADAGEPESARDEWEMARRLVPHHTGALLGLAFLAFQEGRFADAETLLEDGVGAGADPVLAAALERVREGRRTAERAVASTRGDAGVTIGEEGSEVLLLDGAGFVLDGAIADADGRDVSADVGGLLAGVADEARWATEHLGIGAWRELVVEGPGAALVIVPAGDDGLVVVAARGGMPLGRLRRAVARVVASLSGGQG